MYNYIKVADDEKVEEGVTSKGNVDVNVCRSSQSRNDENFETYDSSVGQNDFGVNQSVYENVSSPNDFGVNQNINKNVFSQDDSERREDRIKHVKSKIGRVIKRPVRFMDCETDFTE